MQKFTNLSVIERCNYKLCAFSSFKADLLNLRKPRLKYPSLSGTTYILKKEFKLATSGFIDKEAYRLPRLILRSRNPNYDGSHRDI